MEAAENESISILISATSTRKDDCFLQTLNKQIKTTNLHFFAKKSLRFHRNHGHLIRVKQLNSFSERLCVFVCVSESRRGSCAEDGDGYEL